MNDTVRPLQIKSFLKAVLDYLEPFKETYLYKNIIEDLFAKTDNAENGYGYWLDRLLKYLSDKYELKGKNVLDLGCGTGELTVRMNKLGYNATGIDICQRSLDLAGVLAKENNVSGQIFVFNKENRIPFDNDTFDVITMFSIFEHLSDVTLQWLLPELRRICRGVIYVLVPNKLKKGDDHTGLWFVPWMPRSLAKLYVKLHGFKYRYFISESGDWDVQYRWFGRIACLAREHSFTLEFPQDNIVYPPLDSVPPIFRIGKNFKFRRKGIFIGMPLPWSIMTKLGYPKQSFYPYLNLLLIPSK